MAGYIVPVWFEFSGSFLRISLICHSGESGNSEIVSLNFQTGTV